MKEKNLKSNWILKEAFAKFHNSVMDNEVAQALVFKKLRCIATTVLQSETDNTSRAICLLKLTDSELVLEPQLMRQIRALLSKRTAY